jgi:rod shape-determining protein MreC
VAGFRDLGLSFFSGMRGGIYGLSSMVSHTVLSVKELAVLREEYAELLKRQSGYERMQRSAAGIIQENQRLRDQLGFSKTLMVKHIPAQVIGRDPDNLFSALVINKGSREGIRVNMPVVAFQNGAEALVGKVVQAGFVESFVMPLYDTSFYVSARLAQSRYEGLIEGQGNADSPLLMRSIPKRAREDIHAGDMIITSGLGRVYPPGITVGRVSRLMYQDYGTSMSVELEPTVDFSRLEYVFALEGASND